ncbi:MAG TPA: Maf family protein [Thermoanaerobaculia bacterium]|nr:Maf family protein [Thermoanaerobaculia bacterium]
MATTPDPGLPRLVLASGSPRRRELLEGLGLRFEVRPVDLDESVRDGERPGDYVERLAREKAAERCGSDELVLAADTTVVVDGRILGKPLSRQESTAMLAELSGREHLVLTGIAVARREGVDASLEVRAEVVTTGVRFAPLAAGAVRWYVDSGEGADKAGAYGIQGLGALFVESIDGNYTNVVGLPLPQLEGLVGQLGRSLLDWTER